MEDIISCLEKGEFRLFPKSVCDKKGRVKSKNSVVEMNCECGLADAVEDMVGCDWKKGIKSCNVWKHKSCAGVINNLNWFCSKHN